MVSFSSASFLLSAEAVGLALQCCIGGSATGFNVQHLGKRTFRFSMASNRVGHFIYGLKDRVWPDFVCHFHLFKNNVDYSSWDNSWHFNDELCDISARTPIAIQLDLGFLRKSAAHDHSADKELAKFGFSFNDSHWSGSLATRFDECIANGSSDDSSQTHQVSHDSVQSDPVLQANNQKMEFCLASSSSQSNRQRNFGILSNLKGSVLGGITRKHYRKLPWIVSWTSVKEDILMKKLRHL